MVMAAVTSTLRISEPKRPTGAMRGDAVSPEQLKKGRSHGKMLLKSGLVKSEKMMGTAEEGGALHC